MNAPTPLKLKIIMGSTREARVSEKIAPWVLEQSKKHPGFTAEVLDLRDYDMPFFNESIAPGDRDEPFTSPESVVRWTEKIAEADAFLVIAPEYNRGYPAVLKNAFDWVYREWNDKPIAFVAYGGVGGARSVEQLRLVSIPLQMAPIRQAVHIPERTYLDEKGDFNPEALISFAKPADALFTQLLRWANAFKTLRKGA
jgi:NAD(P)H-dependent FMN reductase